jgi:hypothetical protein
VLDALVMVLEALAAQAAPNDVGPRGGVERFLPTTADLPPLLPDVAARNALLTGYLTEVQANWTALANQGLIDKLERARTVTPTATHTPGVAATGLRVEQHLEEYVLLDNRSSGDPLAEETRRTLVGYELLTGTRPLAAVTDTTAHAIEALMNLRRLNDVLLRVRIALEAASVAGVPVPRALALHRVEGNMNVPPSAASTGRGIPSGTKDYSSFRTQLSLRPDLGYLILVFSRDRMGGSLSDDELKDLCVALWAVQIGGLDQIGLLASPRRLPFRDWSSAHWRAAGRPASAGSTHTADALQRWDALVAQLSVARVPDGGDEAWIVEVDDPVTFVAALLAEALVLQTALALPASFMTGAPPTTAATPLPVPMAYLHFHAGSQNFRTILVRAVAAVRHTTGTRWQPLRRAIAADTNVQSQTTVLDLVEKSPTDVAVALASAMWWAVEAWLSQAGNLTLLLEFLEQAPLDTGWTSWTQHRVNLSRYRVLLSYYERLLA